MLATSNPKIFKCKQQSVWCPNIRNISGPKIQTHLDVTHSMIFIDDTGTISIFDVPPYGITIFDTKNADPRTVITERISRQVGDQVQLDEREVLVLDAIMSLPWHDTDQVIERIKTYLLFS